MYCSKCGTAVSPDSAFCTACGTPQVRPAIAAPGAVTVPPNVGVAGYSAGRGQFVYGDFWLRLVAYVLDSLIMGVIIVPLFLVLAAITGAAAHIHNLGDMPMHGQPDPAFIAALISIVITFVLAGLLASWLYHAYFESSSWQGTPGKKVMNLYVTDLSGQPITFWHATGRLLAKVISSMIPFMLGYIMAAFTERRQALHDMIAGTLVLKR